MASVIPSPPLGTDAAAGPLLPGATPGAGPTGAAERRFRFELAAHPGSPAQARRLTRSRLTGWSVCEDTCDTAALVVSELVTNAIVHTASNQIVCELHDGDDLVRISVRDEGFAPGEPHPSPQRPEEEHGRGLLLVEALCCAWGAQEHGPGLVVWAELPRTAVTAGGTNESVGDQEAVDGHKASDDRKTVDGYTVLDDHEVVDELAARGDLGWGARPKPGPARHPGDEDDPQAQHGPHTPQHTPHTPHTPHQHAPHIPQQPRAPRMTQIPHNEQETGAVWL